METVDVICPNCYKAIVVAVQHVELNPGEYDLNTRVCNICEEAMIVVYSVLAHVMVVKMPPEIHAALNAQTEIKVVHNDATGDKHGA